MSAHRFPSLRGARRLSLCALALLHTAACGGIGCPQSFDEVDGVCVKLSEQRERESAPQPLPNQPRAERCDGADNDLDNQVDELWPELGQPCGPAVGECISGVYVCTADGSSIECDGAVGPSVEICDGLDNDCDGWTDNGPPELCNGEDDDCNGLIDDGVLSIKQEAFEEHATVAATASGFALTRALPSDLRVATYDNEGNRTGHFDDIEKPYPYVEFIESSASEGRLLVGYGKHRFYMLEANIDDDDVPAILDIGQLHREWDQDIDFGVFEPPVHPRVAAFPARFVGFSDFFTFAVSSIGDALASGLRAPPASAPGVSFDSVFDVAGSFVTWEDGDNVRIGWLLDDGTFAHALDAGRGTKPAIATRKSGGAGLVFLQGNDLRISEFSVFSLPCTDGEFCNARIDIDPVEESRTTVTGLAYVEATDTWFIAVDDQLLAVGRVDGEPVVQQSWRTTVSGGSPTRVDVESSGATAAVLQSSPEGDSVLTFVGCL